MTLNLKKLFITSIAMMIAFCMYSQGVEVTPVTPELPEGLPNPLTDFAGAIEVLYGVGVIVLGYLSQLIPGVNKVKPWIRVIMIGVVSGGAIISAGASSFLPILLAYLTSSEFYDKVLKRILGLRTQAIPEGQLKD